MTEQVLPKDAPRPTGRELLQAAHEAGQNGYDVFAHVAGVTQLHVRTVEFMSEDASIATVYCWRGEESEAETWLVPLAFVRAIEIKGHWRPEN